MDDKKRTKRKYELKQRAAEMAATRLRITEAAVELHGTIGPARTTVSAVAKRAGVQRHTVYRHFPSDRDLFGACSAHYFTANPFPEPEIWRAISDSHRRVGCALDDLYAYYERTEPMYSNVLRDLDLVADLRPAIIPLQRYLDDVVTILAEGWGVRGRKRRVLDAALHHVIDFQTWRSLTTNDRISRAEATELAVAFIAGAAGQRPDMTD
jgi:AcrR family transcriptional regulator